MTGYGRIRRKTSSVNVPVFHSRKTWYTIHRWTSYARKSKRSKRNSCGCRNIFDVAGKEHRQAELRVKSEQPDLWNNPGEATTVLKELEAIDRELSSFGTLSNALHEVSELSRLYGLSDDEMRGLESEYARIEREADSWEFRALLSGPYDTKSAILSIHAGAGGVDAQDWAEMLLRMYLRYAEGMGYKTRVLEESRGTEAGIKSVTFEIAGGYAYGYLKAEAGVHRLVRLSPFGANQLRQTSFALVEVLPEIDNADAPPLKPDDLRIDTYRASGAGGQHVNKTESAVRVTHLPTGLVGSSQNERSQLQNKEQAMKILTAKLLAKKLEDEEKERQEIKGEHKSAEWGNQIRSNVLHPYTMVKDHRTKEETSNTEKVLGGDIQFFIESYLRAYARTNTDIKR